MLKAIDSLLNNTTMYRLLVYGLSALALLCILLSALGSLGFSAIAMIISLALLLTSSYGTNYLLRSIWKIPTNTESWLITGLILFFILPPTTSIAQGVYIFLAGSIAMAAKFIVTIHNKHLFNPAAFSVAILSASGLLTATWWVGSSLLWPFTLLLGLIILRKIRRFYIFGAFVLVTLTTTAVTCIMQEQSVVAALKTALIASPLIFLGTIMLTEPATMPPRKHQQLLFASGIGALYAVQASIGQFFISPEIALLCGNIFAFAVGQKYRLRLTLSTITHISPQITDYAFVPDRSITFLPGQYLEWTLPGVKADDRGNRRTFSIASSPTEKELHLGVKFYQPTSAFKQHLQKLQPGDTLFAGQLAGNFTLPVNQKEKLLLIAGGIGITPFRSMLRYLADKKEQRDIHLIYLVAKAEDIAYKDTLDHAAAEHCCTSHILVGTTPLDATALTAVVPDWQQRTAYLSGPNRMVEAVEKTLTTGGLATKNIKKDYFAGY